MSDSTNLVNLGIVGFGRAGGVHLDALNELGNVAVSAISDPSDDARQRAAGLGLGAYATPNEMFDSCELDAVMICTPPSEHAAIANYALEKGLHVLCEKPLATTSADALSMLKAASREKRHLLLATKFRHVEDIRAARDLIASGEIGEPLGFDVSFCSRVDMSGRWNSDRHLSGGGVIIDNGCHAFDIVSYLFGTVTRVQATALKPLQEIDVEDSATIQVRATHGVIGKIDLSWSFFTGRDSYLTVQGSEGIIEVGWATARFKRDNGEWQPLNGGRYDKIGSHSRMFGSFVDVISSPESAAPWISSVEALRTVAAVDAAYKSMETGTWEWVDTRAIQDNREVEAERRRA